MKSLRQQILILGASGKIGSLTLQYLCKQYSSELTPVAGIRNIRSSEALKLGELSTNYNLLIKEVDITIPESILNAIDQVKILFILFIYFHS